MVNAQTLPSWSIGPFTRPANAQPVISPNKDSTFNCPMRGKTIHWETNHTFNPAAIVKDNKIFLLYRAEDDFGQGIGGHTSRLGLAESDDGIHFTRRTSPVFFPADDEQKPNEWDGGCEDPRLVESEDGTYVLLYTQWNHKLARLGIATSKDLITWTKLGSPFTGNATKAACKSAAIVTKLVNGRLIAAKVDDKYLMYFGEGSLHLATSPDLIHWTVIEATPHHWKDLMSGRKGKFDSKFVEGGPPAILTDAGILVLYNGVNGKAGDNTIGENAYAGGQALFDPKNPTTIIDRLDKPFFKPEQSWEKTGQYPAGTTFIEGLVAFKGKWFLYYGCADSYVGVAISEMK